MRMAKIVQAAQATASFPANARETRLDDEARGEEREAQAALAEGELDVLEIVKKPIWRELLVELVVSKQMNLWNIDLVEIADSYLARVRELKALDLRIPANVILASAILLHFKASALLAEEDEEGENAPVEVIQEDIPQLVYKTQGPRTRRITFTELVEALEKVLKEPEREVLRTKAKPLELRIPQQEMSVKMEEVYRKALALKDEEGLLMFSHLLSHLENGNGRRSLEEKIVFTLLPVLHLVQESKLFAWQESVFGDIFIKVLCE